MLWAPCTLVRWRRFLSTEAQHPSVKELLRKAEDVTADSHHPCQALKPIDDRTLEACLFPSINLWGHLPLPIGPLSPHSPSRVAWQAYTGPVYHQVLDVDDFIAAVAADAGGCSRAGRPRRGAPKQPLRPGPRRRTLGSMEFWTIEVADGPTWSAGGWRRAHGELLVEAAVTHGAKDWQWVVRGWGVLLEIAFTDESEWLRFRATPAVKAALDAAPDPVNGRWIYGGRGGSSATREPRRPRPIRGCDGAPLPEPDLDLEHWQQPLGLRHGRTDRWANSTTA